ncbi:GNAT family N-acetyltransferase [Dyella sp. 2RAB6]|uniref:GNAT family N-acetyltransferase n=1 Tax=Dyella sp. 2RAB6 TaxID=3232992 RepID=UPI003F8F7FBA
MFDFRPVATDSQSLARYVALFARCFPGATHLHEAYLEWLYSRNPAGKVVGMDAIAGNDLAAHYVCIPANLWLGGRQTRALLSLNTATHPDYQGKGLFTTLAQKTYELGASQGFSAVYGVANANSTPGFIRKLGFALVAPLEARVGLGRVIRTDWNAVKARAAFRHDWTQEHLAWRAASPTNPVFVGSQDAGGSVLFAKTDKPGIVVEGETGVVLADGALPRQSPSLLRLYLGLSPSGAARRGLSMGVPDRLRPSPLNLIYRSLDGVMPALPATEVQFNFLDFDAY